MVTRLGGDHVSDLESQVSCLKTDLESKVEEISVLKNEAVQMKVAFADGLLSLQRASPTGLAGSSFSGTSSHGPSYASVARRNSSGSVLVAKCADASAPPLNVQAVEELLDTPNSGLIPSHVRFKNNKMFVTLDNEVAVAKAAALLNNKPDFSSRFEPASKLNVSFPVVALFVNISDVNALKVELEHRNSALRGQIHSVKVIYTKPQTTEGHVKIFLKSRAVRDLILDQRRASISGTYYRIVPVDLNREVRRCFKCQRYGHIQRDCSARFVACGKCAERHGTKECTSVVLKCVNCNGSHQSGHNTCSEQVKAVERAGKPVCMHISNSAACVELTTNKGPLRLSSVYLRPSIVDFSATTLTILEALSAPFSIIGADANARSRMWDSPFNDKRGSDLESLLACSNLRVVNQPHSELDFVPAGTTFVDLTLAGDKDWSNSKNAQNEMLYRRSKAGYQRELRAAKRRAWEKARTNATNGDMFRVLSEFAGKTKSISLPSEVSIDGALSADPILIAEGCARHFFPVEPPSQSTHSAVESEACCLRQSFGYDRKRLRFLYSSTVEPIFTYGCSVWASVLRTKAGSKKIRSFQRLICRMITRSFKTAPTESLIILSNMLPLDLRILEIATSRLLSQPAGEFVKSSSKLILKRLPHELMHKKSERVSTFHSTQHPPWRICLYSSSLSYASVDLFPCALNTLRCYIRVFLNSGAAGLCVVVTNSAAVIRIRNLSLPPSISFRSGLSVALAEAIETIKELRPKYTSSEIILVERLVMLSPAATLSLMEVSNLDLLAIPGNSCHVFTAANPNSPGLALASFWAKYPSPFTTRYAPVSQKAIQKELSKYVWNMWNKEWVSLSTNLSVKAFFPDVYSANRLLKVKTSAISTQLLTGHCPLNAHQHRPLEAYLICSVPVARNGVRERAFPLATHPATGDYGLTASVRALLDRLALSSETQSARFS
ncbi:LOW QUALITY PROTEIN: uncharacterized protein LOC123468139 [Daphnia magna]|uniref:LOW QUALITY PROTEIN: uncharacterized protein LOC123468139 n=1 Tax=Daphnia magna TaxID=35525 RepID=UPI001E1BDA20|nr:LOW QUALITY PROTEIN: uncharacterized protein LOC123468139 [Daphnia magna]